MAKDCYDGVIEYLQRAHLLARSGTTAPKTWRYMLCADASKLRRVLTLTGIRRLRRSETYIWILVCNCFFCSLWLI
jgi:hypothetical protein